MKESKLYLQYLRNNLVVILFPAVLFVMGALIYFKTLPQVKVLNRLYEVEFSQNNITERINLADQVVSIAREQNLKDSLGISSKVIVSVFKPGPLLVSLKLKTSQKLDLNSQLFSYDNFLKTTYPVHQVGNDVFSYEIPNFLFYLTSTFFMGVLLGLIISLTREYFKKF